MGRLGEDLRLTPEEMEQGATRKRVRSHIEKKRRERHLRRQAAQLRNSMRRKDALGESTQEAFSFGRPLTALQSHGVRGKKRSLLSIDEPFERPLDDTSPLGNYELGEVAHALKKDATANARLVNKATKQSKTIVKQNKAFQQQKAKEDIKKKKADKAAADKQKKAADKAAKDKKKAADKAAKDKKKAADKQKKAADKAAKDKKKKADKAAKDKKKAADKAAKDKKKADKAAKDKKAQAKKKEQKSKKSQVNEVKSKSKKADKEKAKKAKTKKASEKKAKTSANNEVKKKNAEKRKADKKKEKAA